MEKTLRGLTASHTRGEEEEKERRESYHTWRFYHMAQDIPSTGTHLFWRIGLGDIEGVSEHPPPLEPLDPLPKPKKESDKLSIAYIIIVFPDPACGLFQGYGQLQSF
ncbi:hypothetical protein PCH_Pc20g13160 [Penicillium rubens Wisconsin 54-1255]|uniref:Uncharacterized protein n=1 Tax=Penicillium rubens (strain ATCC 28089 / DSM 1075 / NRRL 1951 / Wisconsin 54-1255) TaxID=500485 RepID=B6HGQ3_PENRW|nr:hypothetical protein PCH_Pc20g13160 [Penicillium rubens Wisconsin 54-1255]